MTLERVGDVRPQPEVAMQPLPVGGLHLVAGLAFHVVQCVPQAPRQRNKYFLEFCGRIVIDMTTDTATLDA